MKQYSEACEQNKAPILAVIGAEFAQCKTVLEIGSGTGQHAVYFARHLEHLLWQPSDLESNHASIHAWRIEAQLDNLLTPMRLDVTASHWPDTLYDGVFSANTTHIMSWPAVEAMFGGIGRVLAPGGIFCLYGPFNYQGRHTSASNAQFDRALAARDPLSGLRNFEALEQLAGKNELQFRQDHEMPVNNRLLVWRKIPEGTA